MGASSGATPTTTFPSNPWVTVTVSDGTLGGWLLLLGPEAACPLALCESGNERSMTKGAPSIWGRRSRQKFCNADSSATNVFSRWTVCRRSFEAQRKRSAACRSCFCLASTCEAILSVSTSVVYSRYIGQFTTKDVYWKTIFTGPKYPKEYLL